MTSAGTREPTRSRHPEDSRTGSSLALVVAAVGEVAEAVRDLAERTPPDPHRLLRAEEVAQLLQLPARTVRDRAAAGAIPHRRFGKHYRFSLSDVEQIVRSMERIPHQQPGPLQAAA